MMHKRANRNRKHLKRCGFRVRMRTKNGRKIVNAKRNKGRYSLIPG